MITYKHKDRIRFPTIESVLVTAQLILSPEKFRNFLKEVCKEFNVLIQRV